MGLAEVRSLFEPAAGTIYLDTATYGLPPRPTVEAMHTAVAAWQAGTADWVSDWDMRGQDCRAAFGRLIGVPADAVALLPSVSVGVGIVAASLTENDEVVVSDDEFLSVLYPIMVAAREHGARVRTASFQNLADAVNERTTLVAFSLVQSQGGRTANQRQVIDAAEKVGARSLVDATHALPFVSVDSRADYVVCAAYKHLLCPRGVAFMHVAPDKQHTLAPWLANWRSAREPYGVHYGGALELATGAAQFDVSLAWFSWVGAAISLNLLVDWQERGFLHEPIKLTKRLANHLGLPEPGGSVLGVPVQDAELVRNELARSGIKAAVRAGSVRLSTHVYTTAEQIDTAANALAGFVLQAAAR